MNSPTLGIDIAKAKFDVALYRDGKLKHKAFRNDSQGHQALLDWLARQDAGAVHVCLEATGIYGEALAECLVDAGLRVSLVNPARIKGFAQSELLRSKTDKADAGLIARFCAAMQPESWQPLPKASRQLRDLVRRLDALIGMRQQERNRLEAAQGVFADITRFRSAKALAAFVGVAPRIRQSGASLRERGMLSKMGRSALRKAFFMPALVALKYNPLLIEMKERLTAAGKPKMAIVGTAMRKLIHIVYGVLKHKTPFNPELTAQSA